MKRGTLAAMVVLALSLPMANAANPILTGFAEAHIYVEVVANIAVGVITPNVNVGQIAKGVFKAEITFRIDANVERVNIQITATDLYKGDDPASSWKIPVLGQDKDEGFGGALVEPTNGNATGGHGNLLRWEAGAVVYKGMSARQSEAWDFESGQNAHFSQDVKVTVWYDQNYDELPKGEYSGWVKLVAEILP